VLYPDKPSDVTPRNDLEYWVRRCCDSKNSNASVFYLIYQGVDLRLHPKRGAYLQFQDKQITLEDTDRYTGRQWLKNFLGDIEDAYRALLGGRGNAIEEYFGDRIREEIARRAGASRRLEGERTSWIEWLMDDELPLVMGSWCYQSGLVTGKFSIRRVPKVDYYVMEEEFEQAAALSHGNLFVTLKRLAVERMKRAEALKK
jgi:hypothetical protein